MLALCRSLLSTRLGPIIQPYQHRFAGGLVVEARHAHLNTDLSSPGQVEGRVHSIDSFTCVDGHGIRFQLFLQGCTRRCVFCSNPDTWDIKSGGEIMTVNDIVKKIKKCRPYLISSGGGVTVSGGDPILQPYFCSALFQEVRKMGLSTAIDTSGAGNEKAWDMVFPHTDTALLCVKSLDKDTFRRMVHNSPDSMLHCATYVAKHGVDLVIRYVLVPGWTDSREQLKLLSDFALRQPTLKGIELLPYHVLGRQKWQELGIPYPLDGVSTPSAEAVNEAVETLRNDGLKVICTTVDNMLPAKEETHADQENDHLGHLHGL